MATINDILDWLNQGAQGDIPGTGGEQPNAPAASESTIPTPTPAAATPSGPTPQDYADEIPPDLMPHYQALVQGGLPPQMAHHILTQPSEGEDRKPGSQTSRAYEAGKGAGTSLMHLLFGAPPSQQSGQSQGHQGMVEWLGNWLSPPEQSSDTDLFTGGL